MEKYIMNVDVFDCVNLHEFEKINNFISTKIRFSRIITLSTMIKLIFEFYIFLRIFEKRENR